MESILNLTDKTVAVTGGNSGIGLAISQLFMSAGAKVYVLDLKPVDLPNNITGVVCDVSKEGSVVDAFETLPDHLDILVNNAGIAHIGNLEATSESDFDKLFQVNVKGVFNCLKAGVKRMKAEGGSIINMASIASLVGIKDRFAYSMTKGAVLTMTYSVAKDYLDYNIRCNAIAPARIHTPFVDNFIKKNYPGKEQEMFDNLSKTQPIGRMGKPEEVANLALFLASDASAFITGSCYEIDGGFTKLNN
jgi:NAD(P)-dependent dehydrogenase (short-subunit alcohol dehydrogenase family)